MDGERTAATACVVACVGTVALTVLPYLLAAPGTVELYYRITPVGPQLSALFAVVTAIVVAAGARRRTDPATAAGAAVVLGLVAAGTAWWWAPSVVLSTAAAVTPVDAFRHHRWAVAIAATAVAVTALWYAKSTLR